MKFDLDILFGTIIGILIILVTIQFKEKQNLQTQIDELRLLFNQKFLQEMVTDEPKLRTLEYRPDDQAKLFRISI
jgi:uncharacterized membrane-anchored protein YhcB (DUF1043 family)